jgi:hypothetical protein
MLRLLQSLLRAYINVSVGTIVEHMRGLGVPTKATMYVAPGHQRNNYLREANCVGFLFLCSIAARYMLSVAEVGGGISLEYGISKKQDTGEEIPIVSILLASPSPRWESWASGELEDFLDKCVARTRSESVHLLSDSCMYFYLRTESMVRCSTHT